MELPEVLRTNGACREFTEDAVADATLFSILDTARYAPSGGNRQGWSVIVVKDPGTRRRIRGLSQRTWRQYAAYNEAGIRPFSLGSDGRWPGHRIDIEAAAAKDRPLPFVDNLETVPVLLAVAYDLRELAFLDIDAPYQPIAGGGSIYPFAYNILLAARNLGLGGVLTTFLTGAAAEARPLLGIPDSHALACVIALGYPAHPVTRLKRKPVESFTTIDRHDGEVFTG